MNVHFSSATDHWSTPKEIYEALHREFKFNCDPCPLNGNDGLSIDWGTSTFCNPPYSEISKWIKKGYEEHLKGKTIVFLIPSRTDTRWWHDYCMKGEIRFIKGRLKFGDAKNSAPFPSAIVIFKSSGKNKKYYSNCCWAFMGGIYEEISICPDCKEHCGMEEDEC